MAKKVLKIDEAIAFYNKNRKEDKPILMKSDIAKELFPDSKEATQVVNMSNLTQGKTHRVDPNLIKKICKITGVDANFLLDVKKMKKKHYKYS